MRILRVSHDYLLNVGGMMVHLRGLNRQLARSRVEVDQAFLIGDDDFDELLARGTMLRIGESFLQKDGMVNLFPIKVPQYRKFVPEMDSDIALERFESQLSSALRTRRPDIVHVHLVKHAVQLRAIELAKAAGIPTVMTHHEGLPESESRDYFLQKAATLADFNCAISKHSASAIRTARVDYRGFFIDTEFWTEARVRPDEVQNWKKFIADRGGAEIVYVYPARFIERKNQQVLIQAAHELKVALESEKRRIPFKVLLVGETLPFRHSYLSMLRQKVVELGLSDEVLFVDSQGRESLRALLHVSDVVVYPAFNEGAGRSHLEGMLLGCCAVVANDAGLVEYIRHDQNGIVFSPKSSLDLAAALTRVALDPQERRRLAEAGRLTASKLTLKRYAADHLELYSSLLRRPSKPKTRRSPSKRTLIRPKSVFQARSRDNRDSWIQETILVLDLDNTIIRPRPVPCAQPTPFPLRVGSTLRLETELDRIYEVRSGLESLVEILRLPWGAKILLSMSTQAKVEEAVKKIRVGKYQLAELLDAYVGKESLKDFAEKHDISLPIESNRGLQNPLARAVRMKPSEFLLQANIPGLARNGQNGTFAGIPRPPHSTADATPKVVWIDDRPSLTKTWDDLVIAPVLTFEAIEHFEKLVPQSSHNSIARYNFLDHLWRVLHQPFSFLVNLLNQNPGWEEFKTSAQIEFNVLEALAVAPNSEQFSWMRDKALASNSYSRYWQRAMRRNSEIEEMRMREHARVYVNLVAQKIAADLDDGAHVLFLGRDMDYAFQVARQSLPLAVKENRLASLPLSRASLRNTAAGILCDLIKRAFPGMSGGQLKIYDVGFHGSIVQGIIKALASDPVLDNVQVVGELLNACDCASKSGGNDSCYGTGNSLQLFGPYGKYCLSREFGISIERLPHRRGCLTRVKKSASQFKFHYAPHRASETQQARTVEKAIRALVDRTEVERHSSSRAAASEAAIQMRAVHSRSLTQLRKLLLPHYELGKSGSGTESISSVIYPFSGADLLFPLLLFPRLEKLVLIDRMSVGEALVADPKQVAGYNIEFIKMFLPSLVQSSQRLNRCMADAVQNEEVLTSSLLSLAQTLGYLGFVEQTILLSSQYVQSEFGSCLEWELSRSETNSCIVQYYCFDIVKDIRKFAGVLGDHAGPHTALLLKGTQGIFGRRKGRLLRYFVREASTIVHDSSSDFNWLDVRNGNTVLKLGNGHL